MPRRPVDAPYRITTEFGVPDSNAKFGKHSGVDYAVEAGRPIKAPASGVVEYAQYHRTGGNMVIIRIGSYWHRLMHNSKFNVSNGQRVNEGDTVAFAGTTGLSTGNHCHWDINKEGHFPSSFAAFIDPWQWLQSAAPEPAPAPAPAPSLQPHQRLLSNTTGVNQREQPNTSSRIIKEWPYDQEPFNFKGFVRGESVSGNNVWFVGAKSGGYFWSGAFKGGAETSGLSDLTPAPNPEPVPPPAPEPIPDHSKHVIDISNHNKVLDYDAVIRSVRAVIAKAGHTGKSYGGTPINGDPTFATHKNRLGDKLVGAYWYAYPSLDWQAEASAFIETVGVVPDTFSYWLDIEELDGKTPEEVNQWCINFLNKVEGAIKRKCGVYMNRNWHDTYINDAVKDDRPIWLAHYGIPEMSNPVRNQVAHQFTSSGRVEGIEGNVDINAVTSGFFIPPAEPTPPPADDRIEKMDKFLRDTFRSYQ